MKTPSSTGTTAEIIGSRCLRGRSGGAGSSTGTPPYGRATRGGRLNSTRLREATASTARRWSRIDSRRSPISASWPGRSTVGVEIALAATTTPFFEPRSVIVTTSVTLMRAWRMQGLLVLDDDVAVEVVTEHVVAIPQGVLGSLFVAAGDHKRRGDRFRRHGEEGVDRVDERQAVARADVDVSDTVVAAGGLARAGHAERGPVAHLVQERQGVGDVTERGAGLDLERDVGRDVGAVDDLDQQPMGSDGTDAPRGRHRGPVPIRVFRGIGVFRAGLSRTWHSDGGQRAPWR